MSSRSTIVAIVFVVLAIGGGVYYQQRQNQAANAAVPSKGEAAKGDPVKGGGAAQRGAPVMVAPVEQRDIPLKINVAGRTEAFSTVTMRARVDGQILSVHYQAGQQVKKGQAMVTLDDRALRAQVEQGVANLARDRAQLDKAKSDLSRQTDLLGKGFISAATLEGFKATVQTLEATVNADLAALDLAKVNLSYATMSAPMNGVAGAVLAFPGGSVKANDTPLVVINQANPLYVTFSLPESQLKEISRDSTSGKLKVEARTPGAAGTVAIGELSFIDNTVDSATGTIQLKARLDNSGEKLTPGQFVEVAMTVRNLPGALLIPAEALQAGPNGNFVYVAKPDNTVELRMVQTIPTDRQLLIVEKGLKPGEKVITDGQLRLTPGAKYEVRTAAGGGGGPPGKGDASKEGAGKAGKDGAAKEGAPKDAPKEPAATKG
jgi:multidrug efflux system membrane fusion protein